MGKLIVNEQDVKRIVDESTTNETGIINQFVNKEIQAEVNKLHLDIKDYDMKHTEENNRINKAIENLLNRISILEEQKKDDINVVVSTNTVLKPSEVNDILDIRSLCRKLNIPGFAPTNLKYYLYEHGIFDMKINEFRNSYFVKQNFDESVDKELLNYIHILKKKITFSKDIITYFDNNRDKVKESINRYEKKEKEYKIARKNVSTKLVQNYREEIKRICGLDSPDKWIPMYKEFSKSFPNFYKDWEKCDKEYREKYPMRKNGLTKVKYVVENMQQGNVLLKIACQLYVD